MRRRDDSNRFENPIMLKSVVRVVNVIQATNIQLVGAIHRADVNFSLFQCHGPVTFRPVTFPSQ